MYHLLYDGRLDESDLKSEYERGFVDCWNRFMFPLNGWEIWEAETRRWITHPEAVEDLRKSSKFNEVDSEPSS